MSKLKATTVYDAYWKANSVGGGTGILVYLKSEADAVIANRDYEIKKLKDSISKLLNAKTEQIIDEVMQKALIYGEGFVRVEDMMKLIAELRRYKYKHCLDMAYKCVKLCEKSKDLYRWADDENLEHHYNHKIEFFARWNLRWLELAEKFKEAK